MKYRKESPHIEVKILNGANNQVIGNVESRNWMNLGEIFSDGYVSDVIKQIYEEKDAPDTITIMAYQTFNKK